MPPEPFLRDRWATYEFGGSALAVDDDCVWILDGHLPAIACFAADSGALRRTLTVAEVLGARHEASSIAVDATGVYVAGKGLWALDATTGALLWDREVAGSRLVRDGDRLWLGGHGIKCFTVAGERVPVAADVWIADAHAARGDSFYVSAADRGDVGVIHLRRFDLGTATPVWSQRIEGTAARVRHIAVEDDVVWVALTEGGLGRSQRGVVGFDPLTGERSAEVLYDTPEASVVVRDAIAWIFAHAPDRSACTLVAVDLRSGKVLRKERLPHEVGFPRAGPAGVWGGRRPLVGFPSLLEGPVTADLDAVDVAPLRPPRPHSIDAAAQEQKALALLRRHLGLDSGKSWVREVTIEEVNLSGSFPSTSVVVLFRSEDRPGHRFGRRIPLWHPDGQFVEDLDVVAINLFEDITAYGHGLPIDPDEDEAGIAWF